MSIYNFTKKQVTIGSIGWMTTWIVALTSNFNGFLNSLFWFDVNMTSKTLIIILDIIFIFSPILLITYILAWNKNTKYNYLENESGTKWIYIFNILLAILLSIRIITGSDSLQFLIIMLIYLNILFFTFYRNIVAR